MTKEEALQLLNEHFLSTKEALKYLDVSPQALNSLVRRGKITLIEKEGVKLYLREEIEKRKAAQTELHQKFRPYEHEED